MHKSTLLELLRTLTPDELDRFDLFLKSPYFNKAANVTRFFSLLKKYAPDFNDDKLNKETFWSSMFPDKPYNYGSMKNLIYMLTKLGLKFVSQELHESMPMTINRNIIAALLSKGAKNLLGQKLNEAEKFYLEGSLRDKGAYGSDQFYYLLSNMYWNKNFFNISSQLGPPDENIISKASVFSVSAYLILMTKNYNNLLITSYTNNMDKFQSPVTMIMKELNSGFIDKLMPLIKEISEREYHILDLFLKLNKAEINTGSLKCYVEFKEKFYKHSDLLTETDIRGLLSSSSVCLAFLSSKEINKSREQIGIYKFMMQNKLFEYSEGQLHARNYYQYIYNAFLLKEYEELKEFSKKYLEKISGDLIENAGNFTSALLAFGEKKFDQSLDYISKSDYEFFMMKVYVKILKAMCFYELNEYLLFENEYKSLYHFLKNNKSLSPEVRENTKTEFEIINKLFRLKENFDMHSFKILKSQIESSETYKDSWFGDKAALINT